MQVPALVQGAHAGGPCFMVHGIDTAMSQPSPVVTVAVSEANGHKAPCLRLARLQGITCALDNDMFSIAFLPGY